MPLTFPSHAAAVLPFCRGGGRGLPPAALVIGTCLPDFAYLIGVPAFSHLGERFHTIPGVVMFGLPLGVLFWLWLELWVRPELEKTPPQGLGVNWRGLVTTRGFPTTPAAWLSGLTALVVGGATHVLWDGFTHPSRWPASEYFRAAKASLWPGFAMGVPSLLQMISHVVGLVAVILYVRRRFPATQREPTLPGARRLYASVCLGLLLGLVATVFFRHGTVVPPYFWPWALFWNGVRGAMVGITVGCLIERRLPATQT